MEGESPILASTPAGAVFLSYASQDAEAAKRICEALRSAGVEVWFDQSELRGGDLWDQQIRKQIHDCALFIPIISAHSQARLEGYFRREWKLAADRTHDMAEEKAFLVPVVIDDTSERYASVPDKFRDVQWTHLPPGQTTAAFIERVRGLLSSDQAQRSAPPHITRVAQGDSLTPQGMARSASSFRRWRPALLLIAAGAVVAVSYLAVDKLWLSNHAAAGPQTTGPSLPTGVGAPGSVPENSMAVLPFVDMSEKHDQEYFADGMAEEILNLLVKVPDLKVIGRTSSFQFKGKTEDLRKIGTALGAAYVVEGSVRRTANHIRVTAQLIDARAGTHRWSETYDREVNDTLNVQDEIAASLVRALQLEVAGSSFQRGRVLPRNSEAYDSYLRGLHALNRFDQQGFDEASADFRRALQLDPSFLPAGEQLARTLCDQPSWGFVPPRDGFEQARAAAYAVLKLDTTSAIGHAVLGCVATWYDWNWPVAQQELKTALAQAPNDPFVLVTAAIERIAIGRSLEAVQLCDAALASDPLLATLYQNIGWAQARLGQLKEAESAMRRLLEISPTYVGARHDLGVILMLEGRPQDALSEIQKETPIGGRAIGLVLAYDALGRKREAETELEHLEAEHASDMALWIAQAHAFRGQKDKAFNWLDRAYQQKDIFLWSIKGDPLLKNIEADPRYKALLRKMSLPE